MLHQNSLKHREKGERERFTGCSYLKNTSKHPFPNSAGGIFYTVCVWEKKLAFFLMIHLPETYAPFWVEGYFAKRSPDRSSLERKH